MFLIGEICLRVFVALIEKLFGIGILDDLEVQDMGIDYLPKFLDYFVLSPPESRLSLIFMAGFFDAVNCFLSVFIINLLAS